jgi:hypothetical protein
MSYTEVDRYGTRWCYKNGKLHGDGDGVNPAVYSNGNLEYWKNGVKYTKEQVEKMEEIRTRIVLSYARYWYDKTYMNPDNFKRRIENGIGYKFV